ncbi:hypothetical protein diail_11923 [Diaporthe ilicicola]|nr:hypothetical protein diail_11923 [Diaporthe ilicicola]
METVTKEQGHEANKEFAFEDDTVNVLQDEEFDIDIGGPEDKLEALGGLESTDDGLTYQIEGNDALDDAHTYSTQDQGTHEAADELYEDEILGHDQGQHDLEVSAFDASADTEGVDQTFQGDDALGQNESENVQQADEAHYGESENYQEEMYFEETTEELGSFVDAGQQDGELVQTTTITTESVEYSHPEQDQFEDRAHDRDASPQEVAKIQAGDETQPPMEESYVGEATENEAMTAQPRSEEIAQDKSLEQDTQLAGTIAAQNTTSTVDGFEDAGDQEVEVSRRSDEHPRVRVSYAAAEFCLFAVSPDADPDDYFFEHADILQQPLSQFLSSLRQVISEDLQASDELFVKVDGLGLEFGEATTKDFLEQTTFGQILELYERLVKLDDDSFESAELYIYLDTRPNCLHRLTALTNDANEGKGLSQVAFYYEGTPDLAAVEEESNDFDGFEDLDSEEVSFNEPNEQTDGDLSASHQPEQPYNPFRLSESQQQVMDASRSGLVEEEVANESLSADADEGHSAHKEDDNEVPLSGEVQDDLELAANDAFRDLSADGTQRDTDMVPGDDEDLTAEGVDVESESQQYAEEGHPSGEELAGTEANAEPENEHSHEDDGPTDGERLSSLELNGCTGSSEICDCAFCMSGQTTSIGTMGNAGHESEIAHRIPDRQLVEDALVDAHQALIATAHWSNNFSSTANTQDLNNRRESTSADFKMQDYNAAENDDYLDIGATEEEPAESAGTPGPGSHDSSATATLDGEAYHGDDASATVALEDAGRLVQTPSQAGLGSPETEMDEINWNDDDDNEDNNEEVDIANQNQTDLSPSSLSIKRGRQADEDDVGLGDDSIAKRRRT